MRRVKICFALTAIISIALASTAFSEEFNEEKIHSRINLTQVEIWGGAIDRGGDAINQSGNPFSVEDEQFPIAGLNFKSTIPLNLHTLIQLELATERAFDDDNYLYDYWYNENVPTSDDDYKGHSTAGLHLALDKNNILIGPFGGIGQVRNQDASDDDNQNATFSFYGLEAKVNFENISIAAQAGRTQIISSDDDEHFNNGEFARLIGETFFNQGSTMVKAHISWLNGFQDYKDPADIDEIDLFAWGVELEQDLSDLSNEHNYSIFAAYESIGIQEKQFADNQIIRAGIKIRSKGISLQNRSSNTTADLPNIGRWLGLTPAVD